MTLVEKVCSSSTERPSNESEETAEEEGAATDAPEEDHSRAKDLRIPHTDSSFCFLVCFFFKKKKKQRKKNTTL